MSTYHVGAANDCHYMFLVKTYPRESRNRKIKNQLQLHTNVHFPVLITSRDLQQASAGNSSSSPLGSKLNTSKTSTENQKAKGKHRKRMGQKVKGQLWSIFSFSEDETLKTGHRKMEQTEV